MTRLYKGSCLCGGVRFEAGDLQTDPAHCHCSMCRKFHGAAFATLAAAGEFRWLTGEDLVRHYKAANGTVRSFCSRCGTSLAFRSNDESETPYEPALSLFDEEVPVRPAAHIFTNFSATWYRVNDGLPVFGEGRIDGDG